MRSHYNILGLLCAKRLVSLMWVNLKMVAAMCGWIITNPRVLWVVIIRDGRVGGWLVWCCDGWLVGRLWRRGHVRRIAWQGSSDCALFSMSLNSGKRTVNVRWRLVLGQCGRLCVLTLCWHWCRFEGLASRSEKICQCAWLRVNRNGIYDTGLAISKSEWDVFYFFLIFYIGIE